MTSNIISRELGLLEKYQVSKQTTQVYGTLSLSGKVSIESADQRVNREYLLGVLVTAFQQLCNEIPQLSIALTDINTATPKWLILNSIDFDRLLNVVTEPLLFLNDEKNNDTTIITNHIQEELKLDFNLDDKTIPLWRIKIITGDQVPNQFFMIWSFHHVIADGLSTKILWNRLLNSINGGDSTASTKTSTIINIRSNLLKIEPPFDQRTPHQPTITTLLPVLFKHLLLPSFIKKYFEVQYYTGENPAVKELHNTQVMIISVPKDITEELSKKCKQQNTSLHSAIYLTIIKSMLEVFGDNLTIRSDTPFSSRTYCDPPIPDTEVGNFVGGFQRTGTYSLAQFSNEPSFYQECQKYKNELLANSISDIKTANMLKYVGEFPNKWNEFWHNRLTGCPNGRSATFEFSDLGKMNNTNPDGASEGKKWNLESFIFAQSANVFVQKDN
eukprot:gene3940-4917_t